MKGIKHAFITILLAAMLLQLAGCAGGQPTSSEATTPVFSVVPTPAVLSAQMPAESSSPSTQSASEVFVIAPASVAEASIGQEQPVSVAQAPFSEPHVPTSLLEEINISHGSIQVGGKDFTVTLADNQAARAFAAYLPMTMQMDDLNGQEKFYDLPDNLPSNATERPSTIHSGDVMCWSGNTLVLFYQTFSNSYGGYVRLGTVDDPSGLAAALGSSNIEVTWSLTG